MPLTIATFASLATIAFAQSAAEPRSHSSSAVIDAPIERVWDAFTTEGGIEAWMVPVTSIDLRIGGEWRTSYNPASTLDDGDTIVHTILAYEPGRMISVRTAPPANAAEFFGDVDFSQLWSVFRFDPVDGGTLVTVTGLGYGQGGDWDKLYTFFETNNPLVLEALAQHFSMPDGPREPGSLSEDATRVLELLHRWVGGEWIHESTPPGSTGTFRVRNLITLGPDGQSLLCQGWLGGDGGLWPHSLAIIRRSPGGHIVFENVSETGDIARGRITLLDDDSIRWDWNVSTLAGGTERYEIDMDFPADQDSYTMSLARLIENPDGSISRTVLVTPTFTRVEKAPEAFLRQSPAVH